MENEMHLANAAPSPVANRKLDSFLSELTELCKAHGIGIDGEPQLFLYDAEDHWFAYAADDGDRLVRR